MAVKVKNISSILVLVLVASAHAAFASAQEKSDEVTTSFLYKLSDFGGPIPFNEVGIFVDEVNNEIYVTDQGAVRVFNKNGMEIFSFGDDGSLGAIIGTVVDNKGNIIVLSYGGMGKYSVILCNYQGAHIADIVLKNPPALLSDKFFPSLITYRDGRIYLADRGTMKVAVLDEEGNIEKAIDLFPLVNKDEKKRQNVDLGGFSVDREGNILFTVPEQFLAYKLSPDGNLASFGQRGSTPGKFNIVAGIVADDKGYYYVADKLKCAVLIFDKYFKFITQFGYRGFHAGRLIVPSDLAVYDNKLYVVQAARQGVSVFSISAPQ